MKLQELTDKELATLKQDAVEMQDGRLLLKIKIEESRRNREI